MTTRTKLSWKLLTELNGQRASLAERLNSDELAALHIPTKLDDAVMELARQNKRIYLTGNPGDGKTHLIRRHQAELEQIGALVHLDASAVQETVLNGLIAEAISSGRPAVIAINEGPLRHLQPSLPRPDKEDVGRQLARPFLYSDDEEVESEAVVLNLGERQVLVNEILDTAIHFVLTHVDSGSAPVRVKANLEALGSQRVRERLGALMLMLLRTGVHVTMHELLGFLAFIITSETSEPHHAGSSANYFDLVFDERNPLHRWLERFDPAKLPQPILDMQLWDGDVPEGQQWRDEQIIPTPSSLNDSRAAFIAFQRLKRLYYFKGEKGKQIYAALPSDHGEFFKLLENAQTAKDTVLNEVLRAVAWYFGDREANADELPVWTSLRYEAFGPATAFLSSQSIPKKNLRIELPRLRRQQAAWLAYEPTHLRLIASLEQQREVGLLIDLDVWRALMAIKNGMPQRFHDLIVGRRLNDFMSQIDKQLQKTRSGYFPLMIRDVNDPTRPFRVNISIENLRYEL